MHLFAVHRVRMSTNLNAFVRASVCPVCLADFHTRDRALKHCKHGIRFSLLSTDFLSQDGETWNHVRNRIILVNKEL